MIANKRMIVLECFSHCVLLPTASPAGAVLTNRPATFGSFKTFTDLPRAPLLLCAPRLTSTVRT